MKKLVCLVLIYFAIACGEPKHITFNPDDHTATSGTLGSSKATNQVPEKTLDTVKQAKPVLKADTTKVNNQ